MKRLSLILSSLSLLIVIIFVLVFVLGSDIVKFQGTEKKNPCLEQEPSPAMSDTDLTRQKLCLDVRKVSLENQKLFDENESKKQVYFNFIISNLTFFSSLAVIVGGLISFLLNRNEERKKRADERFENVVKSMGSEIKQERLNATTLLSNFLEKGYERFYVRVFNLVAENLRAEMTQRKLGRGKGDLISRFDKNDNFLNGPLTNLLWKSYELARIQVFEVKAWENPKFPENLWIIWHKTFSRKDRIVLEDSQKKESVRKQMNAANIKCKKAVFFDADFNYAWFREAEFNDTEFRYTKFDRADLKDSDWSGAKVNSGSFKGTDLTNADFTSVYFRATTFSDSADIRNAKFTNANLDGGFFVAVDLQDADFTSANINKAEFSNKTVAKSAKFNKARLDAVKFNDVELRDADFSDADFSDVRFEGAKFYGSTDISNAKFTNAGLDKVEFKSVELRGADFSNAKLTNTTFENLNFLEEKGKSLPTFRNVVINSTTLINVQISQENHDQLQRLGFKFVEPIFSNKDT